VYGSTLAVKTALYNWLGHIFEGYLRGFEADHRLYIQRSGLYSIYQYVQFPHEHPILACKI